MTAFDPRTRLVVALCWAGLIVGSGHATVLLGELAALTGLVALWRQVRPFLRWMRLVLPMAVFLGAVTWWTAGQQHGLAAAVKLVGIATTFFLFFVTTAPEDLANALVKAGLPCSAAFVLSASLQFVPVIGRKAQGVLDAQRARGISMKPGWAAVLHYPAFLAPLLIQAFQLAEELAEAMEARGFGRPGRTFSRSYALKPRDWLAMGAAVAALAGLLTLFGHFGL